MKSYTKKINRLLSLMLCLMMALTLLGNGMPVYAEAADISVVPTEETIEKGIPGDETPGDEARTDVETEAAAERTEEISPTGNQLGGSEILELEETEGAPNTATPSEATPQPPLLAPLAPVDEPLTDV